MADVIETVIKGWNTGVVGVLTTIVSVTGSAYRKEGAKMWFSNDGGTVGTLSAGCLEADLSLRAKEALENFQPFVHSYDMTSEDDLGWGRGAGCNGIVEVLVEPIHASLETNDGNYWGTVVPMLNDGHPLTCVRKMDPDNLNLENFLVFNHHTKSWYGTLGNPEQDEHWKQVVEANQGVWQRSHSRRESDGFYFVDQIEPKPQVYVFGAGPDAEPLVSLLATIGFDVSVIDHRPNRLKPELFRDAKRLIDSRPLEAKQKVQLLDDSYAIVMTHSFQTDEEWVHYLRSKRLKYLGVLGPRARTERLLKTVTAPAWLHSPIGLSISADGPEEIAVSVAAELIQVRRQAENKLNLD